MKITEQLISPSIAKQYLENNTNNRSIKPKVVNRYAKDILDGKWKRDTGEMIKISKTGVILDGQHRLYAIVKSNTPVFLHVISDLENSIFDVLDTGTIRNAGDVFKVSGIKNACVTPSIISTYFNLSSGKTGIKDARLTNSVLLDKYEDRADFYQNITNKTQSLYHSFAKILAPSLIGGMYCYFNDINPNDAESFINQLCTGVNIKNDTILVLRTRLMQDKVAPRKMPSTTKSALIIKTWNAYRKNDTLKQLKFAIDEKFPKAI